MGHGESERDETHTSSQPQAGEPNHSEPRPDEKHSRDLKRKRDRDDESSDSSRKKKRKKKKTKKPYIANPARDIANVPKRVKTKWERNEITPICFRYTNVMTPDECEEVRECYEFVLDNKLDKPGRARFGSDSENYGKVGGHKVCYLHKKGAFMDKCGEICERLMEIAYDFDRHHKVLSNEAAPQTVEYIRYKEDDWVGWHTDLNGSVITLVTMLSKRTHYEGGDLEMKLKEGGKKDGKTLDVKDAELGQGDVAVFLCQNQYHRVTPVTWGSRRTMIIEVKRHKDDADHHSDSSSDSDSDGDNYKRREKKKKSPPNYKKRERSSDDEESRKRYRAHSQ